MAKSKRTRVKTGRPRKTSVTLAPMRGDHGTETPAAKAGTLLVPIKNDPNQRAYRKRINSLDRIIAQGKLTMPEQQAAIAIQNAFERTEALSSGGPLKEQVQSSPKPDAAIAAQVDAMSNWAYVMGAVRADREIVEHVCCYGLPIRTLPSKLKRRAMARLRNQLILVAVHLKYAREQDILERVA